LRDFSVIITELQDVLPVFFCGLRGQAAAD
jgi:hypothetical protein